jgi:serine O-acetyltransferase
MDVTIGVDRLTQLLLAQLRHNFLCDEPDADVVVRAIPDVLGKVQACFGESAGKYYWTEDGRSIFNPYHSAQYSIFLYYLSHQLWARDRAEELASKVYLLNKMLSGCDLFYQVRLPEVFLTDHPVGTVLGRASYGNYLMFQQGCTVGGNNGIYPRLGEFVWLFAGATVIGASTIGNNVFVSAGAYVKDADIPDNTIVFGRSPDLVLKHEPVQYFHQRSPFRRHLTAGAPTGAAPLP